MSSIFKLLIASGFFICVISSCDEKEKDVNEANGTILALSYNVAGLPALLSSSKPALYTSHISPLLNKYDIVQVQEDFCYHDSLLLYNNHQYVTDPAPCVPDGDGLNTFSNKKITFFERIPWDDCFGYDCFTPKGFSLSRVELHKGVTVDLYNLHCNAGNSIEDRTARKGNIVQFLEYVKINSLNEPVVVLGDFNSRYTVGDTIRMMLNQGFTDVWLELFRNNEVPSIGMSFPQGCEPLLTSSTCEGIDKAYYRSNDEFKIKAIRYQLGDNPKFLYKGIDSLPLSDHPPLEVEFTYEFKRK